MDNQHDRSNDESARLVLNGKTLEHESLILAQDERWRRA